MHTYPTGKKGSKIHTVMFLALSIVISLSSLPFMVNHFTKDKIDMLKHNINFMNLLHRKDTERNVTNLRFDQQSNIGTPGNGP